MKIVLALLMLTGVTLSSWAQEKEKPREWTQIVAQARKKGKVVVAGSPDAGNTL